MKQIFFLFIIFILFSCQKHQDNNKQVTAVKLPPAPRTINEKTLIGFACYYEGSKSNSVNNVSKILQNKNYENLKVKLYNGNPAEKYLSTVACEKLVNKNLIKLNRKDHTQIKINRASEEKVTICAGCTDEEDLTLKEMFSSEKNFLADSVEEWINETIK